MNFPPPSVIEMANVLAPLASVVDFNCHPTTPSDFVMIAALDPTFAVSYTHADSVMLPVRRRLLPLPRSTSDVEPLNASAVPYLPVVQVGPPVRRPVFPLPDKSAVVSPTPSANPYEP